MKRFSFIIVMAGVLAMSLLSSCKKENTTDGKMVFKATVQQPNEGSKTAIQPDGSVLWTAGDAIKVYNGDAQATFTLSEGEGSTSATFEGELAEADTYYAAYPASATAISTGDAGKVVTFTLPATQAVAMTAGDFDKNVAFMVAASNTQSFAFKNVFGILAVTLKSSTYSQHVSRFVLSAKGFVNIWGTSCSVKLNDDGSFEWNGIPYSGGSNSLTLTCDVNLTSEAQTFYILVPPVNMNKGLCLRIYDDNLTGDPEIYCLETSNAVTIGSNTGATFQHNGEAVVVQPEAPEYVFSVGPTQKVTFSPANLQYTKSTDSWSFMPNEVMTVEANGSVGTNYASQDVVSLFTWGANGNNGILPYNTNNTFWQWTEGAGNGYLLTVDEENGSDWSVKANAANLGGHNDWRTPTQDEWTYLLGTANNAHQCRVNAKNLRKYRAINGVEGLVILPDGSTADIDGAWADLQTVGAVFLPAAGGRMGASVILNGSDGHQGFYWSSKYYGLAKKDASAGLLNFRQDPGQQLDNGVYPIANYPCKYAFSVRLVRNAE